MTDNLSSDLASLKIDRAESPPARLRRGWWRWPVILAACGAVVFLGWTSVQARLLRARVSTTQVVVMSPAQASVELTATGHVKAESASQVAPKVAGRVIAVHVKQGDRVESGRVLLELDPADDRAAIDAAVKEVAAVRAQATSARARAAVAQSELAEVEVQAVRERRLADQGAASRGRADDLDGRVASLRRALAAARADAAAADAKTGSMQAQVSVRETGLRNLQLIAPISGTVVSKPPQVGEYVGPQPPGIMVDMGSIRVADFATLVVETDVPEARLGMVKPGAPTEITLDAYPSRRYPGIVKEVTPEVNRAKATVIVRVGFGTIPEGVLPEMSAKVNFLTKPLKGEALDVSPKAVVPSAAVASRGGAKVVFVVESDQVRQVPVSLGGPLGSGFELKGGPRPGTTLVLEPPPTLADGQSITTNED